jgi:hypothetical protein
MKRNQFNYFISTYLIKMVHKNKSRSRSRSKKGGRSSIQKSKNKSKTRSETSKDSSLPVCKPTFYCGSYKELPKFSDYDKMGSKEECFKKGIGVGMMIELNKVKNKLAKKGIILVTKPFEKSKCVDKYGNIKLQ